ncbi:unnamed protein product [Chrysodeixis includens]|uniref:Uncharacterized protein n=1 Tax=Chrysodeixis includens TaxID=689277 RepID=A0A9N8L504_CHRIL|nr:unnamed protein product [Chrysodeixis includens]
MDSKHTVEKKLHWFERSRSGIDAEDYRVGGRPSAVTACFLERVQPDKVREVIQSPLVLSYDRGGYLPDLQLSLRAVQDCCRIIRRPHDLPVPLPQRPVLRGSTLRIEPLGISHSPYEIPTAISKRPRSGPMWNSSSTSQGGGDSSISNKSRISALSRGDANTRTSGSATVYGHIASLCQMHCRSRMAAMFCGCRPYFHKGGEISVSSSSSSSFPALIPYYLWSAQHVFFFHTFLSTSSRKSHL